MGPPPKQITYTVPKAERRPGCRGVVVRAAAHIGRGSPSGILKALGVKRIRRNAREQLVALVDEHASKLDHFPEVALVAPAPEPEDSEATDLLTAVTIIAKSSDKVFIKTKDPLLSRLREKREIVLLFPITEGDRG